MATVTKPIALDESLNTTELSSRNVADVLAQELSAVATAIGGITHPDAEDIVYDNSVSGLSATDVQNALDEIVSDIPTVNNGTLTIQQNGTSIGSFSANTASNVTANIKTPTADKKTATTEFNTANGGLLSKCQINLAPVQSGSGDPSPDNVRPISGHTEVDLYNVGKNFLPMTLDDIKSINTAGTWAGDVYTNSGITYSLVIDNGFINGIVVNGITSNFPAFNLAECSLPLGTYTFAKNNLRYRVLKNGTQVNDSTSDYTFTVDNESDVYTFRIFTGAGTFSNILYTPIVCLSSESDKSFEPYHGNLYQVQIGSTVYGGYVDLVSGVMVVTNVIKDMGDIIWAYVSGYGFQSQATLSDGITDDKNVWCSVYKFDGDANSTYASTMYSKLSDKQCAWYSNVSRIFVRDDSYTNATSFKTAVTGEKIVYTLATPQTIQLTPQQIEALVGQNNLSTPLSGQIIDSVEYREVFAFDDVEKVVSLRVPISMLGTDESGNSTASRAYTTGEFFYKDGKMYKVLTNIASGATFTVGTNISETTLFAELTALA